jgi:hypothetical protein
MYIQRKNVGVLVLFVVYIDYWHFELNDGIHRNLEIDKREGTRQQDTEKLSQTKLLPRFASIFLKRSPSSLLLMMHSEARKSVNIIAMKP